MARNDSMMRRAVVAIVALAATAPAMAQNLVVNGGFAGNLNSWTVRFDGGAVYSSEDIDLLPNSGSALLGSQSTTAGERLFMLRQCVTIPAIGRYTMTAAGWLDTPSPPADRLHFQYLAWRSNDCSGGSFGGGILSIAPSPTWRITSRTVSVDAVPASIEVFLGIEKAAATGAAAGRFDRIIVERADPVFDDQFE